MRVIVKLIILLSVVSAISSCSGRNGKSKNGGEAEQAPPLELEEAILGEWVAGEICFSQPPAEIQQDIKSISFQLDNIIEWTYVYDGKTRKDRGRYALHKFSSGRGLPTLFVAPERYVYPLVSSICLLQLADIEIDFDERFNAESIGKVLKAKGFSGKALVFVRKGKK